VACSVADSGSVFDPRGGLTLRVVEVDLGSLAEDLQPGACEDACLGGCDLSKKRERTLLKWLWAASPRRSSPRSVMVA
jgi:hypothetical protein